MLKISEGAANMEEEQPVQSHKQGNIEKSIIKEHNLTWKIKLYLFFVCFLKSQRERRSRNNKVRSKFQTETAFYYWNNVKRSKKRLVWINSWYKSFTDADVLNDGEMFVWRPQEMRKFLALPIDKKTFHAAQMTSKLRKELAGELEEEGKEKTKEKSLKQNEGKTTPPKQQSARHKLKMAMMKRGRIRNIFSVSDVGSFSLIKRKFNLF